MPRGSGRRPKPSAVKELQGNAGKRPPNRDEPKPPPGEPEMPPSLGKLARQYWKSLAPDLMAVGVLSTIDGKALAACCHAYQRWVEAEQKIDEYGILVEESVFNKKGKKVATKLKRNPADISAQSWLKVMKSYLIEFGMTPAARTRIRSEFGLTPAERTRMRSTNDDGQKRKEDPAGKYFGSGSSRTIQ
jgi:P27 family predicted phage terminase small subunit